MSACKSSLALPICSLCIGWPCHIQVQNICRVNEIQKEKKDEFDKDVVLYEGQMINAVGFQRQQASEVSFVSL